MISIAIIWFGANVLFIALCLLSAQMRGRLSFRDDRASIPARIEGQRL